MGEGRAWLQPSSTRAFLTIGHEFNHQFGVGNVGTPHSSSTDPPADVWVHAANFICGTQGNNRESVQTPLSQRLFRAREQILIPCTVSYQFRGGVELENVFYHRIEMKLGDDIWKFCSGYS